LGKISRKLFFLLVCASEKVKVKDSHAGIDDRGRDSHLFDSTMTKIQAIDRKLGQGYCVVGKGEN